MHKNNSIIFYFDFSSPYSYFTFEILKSLAVKRKIEFIPIPILIGVIFKKNNTIIPAYDKVRNNYFHADIKRSADLYNIPLHLPSPFPFSSLVLQRLYWYIFSYDVINSNNFISNAFEDIFVKGKTLVSFEDCQHLISKYSISIDIISSGVYKKMPFEKTNIAHKAGVFGVPFYFYNNEQYWGFDRISHLKKFLDT